MQILENISYDSILNIRQILEDYVYTKQDNIKHHSKDLLARLKNIFELKILNRVEELLKIPDAQTRLFLFKILQNEDDYNYPASFADEMIRVKLLELNRGLYTQVSSFEIDQVTLNHINYVTKWIDLNKFSITIEGYLKKDEPILIEIAYDKISNITTEPGSNKVLIKTLDNNNHNEIHIHSNYNLEIYQSIKNLCKKTEKHSSVKNSLLVKHSNLKKLSGNYHLRQFRHLPKIISHELSMMGKLTNIQIAIQLSKTKRHLIHLIKKRINKKTHRFRNLILAILK